MSVASTVVKTVVFQMGFELGRHVASCAAVDHIDAFLSGLLIITRITHRPYGLQLALLLPHAGAAARDLLFHQGLALAFGQTRAPGLQLCVLRDAESRVPDVADRIDDSGLLGRERTRGMALIQAAASRHEPDHRIWATWIFQILQFLRWRDRVRVPFGWFRVGSTAVADLAADRYFVLHLPLRVVHGGCVPWSHPRRTIVPQCGVVRCVLPAARRRPDSSRRTFSAPVSSRAEDPVERHRRRSPARVL